MIWVNNIISTENLEWKPDSNEFGFPWQFSGKKIHLPMQTQVWSLGQEDPLEKEMAITSVFLPGESPWIEEPGGLQSIRSQKSWTWLSD